MKVVIKIQKMWLKYVKYDSDTTKYDRARENVKKKKLRYKNCNRNNVVIIYYIYNKKIKFGRM